MRRRKVWQEYPEQLEVVQQMSSRHGFPPLIARLLVNRGLLDPEDILAFLDPTLERLTSPFKPPGPGCGRRPPGPGRAPPRAPGGLRGL